MFKMKSKIKRILSIVAATALTVTAVPVIGGSTITAHADGTYQKTVASIGTTAIKSPKTGSLSGPWGGNYVWYGKYAEGSATPEPVKYRVLDPKTSIYGSTTMLLDCDKVLTRKVFNYHYEPFTWDDSIIKSWLNGNDFILNNSYFSELERNSIAESVIAAHPHQQLDKDGEFLTSVPLTGEKVFILDLEDVLNPNYGYVNDLGNAQNRCKENLSGENFGYDLRNSHQKEAGLEHAGHVTDEGKVGYSPFACVDGVSPALNINLSSVLFSSRVGGTVEGMIAAQYKLTLLDSGMSMKLQSGQKAVANNNTVTVPYTSAATDTTTSSFPTQISVLILDKEYTQGNTNNANIILYSKLNNTTDMREGNGTFELPGNLIKAQWGKQYHVYLVGEVVNGEFETDYASTPVELSIPESYKGTPHWINIISDGNGIANANPETAIEGDEITLTTTPKTGYRLKEWQVLSGGVTVKDNKFIMKTDNVEIKAIFELIPIKKYTLSFDANGGSGSMADVTANEGTEYTLPACTFTAPEGMEFDKWDLGAAGTKIKVDKNLLLKAIWKKKEAPKNDNSGNGSSGNGDSGNASSGNDNSGNASSGNGSSQNQDAATTQPSGSQEQNTPSENIDKNQKSTSISKAKAGKKSFTLTWKKQTAKGIKGYEIQYSTDKKFKKDVKTVTIKKAKTTSKTIKKLKSKKKYYVRIRTYKKSGKNMVYSTWSKTKSVKVK
jgi:hypothetical protein